MKTFVSNPSHPLLYAGALDLLSQLIAAPSFSGYEDAAADIIQAFFMDRMILARREGNNVWGHNLYYDPEKPTILLNSHIDTIKPSSSYTRNPFDPSLENGVLYGLGSNDAGASVVTQIACFLHFYRRKDLPFNLCIALSAEERSSGDNGICRLFPQMGKIDFAIIGEPTMMHLVTAASGSMSLYCVSASHTGSAVIDAGDNPIYHALQDILWFSSYQFSRISETRGPVKMTVTDIHAGRKANSVPQECSFTVDIRLTDVYQAAEILDIIREHVRCKVEVTETELNVCSINHSHPLVLAGLSIGRKATTSDISSTLEKLGVPAIRVGPGNPARSHAADEFVYTDEIRDGIIIYIKYIEAICPHLTNISQLYTNTSF